MAEISKPVTSWGNSARGQNMGSSYQQEHGEKEGEKLQSMKMQRSDSVFLDVERLSLLAAVVATTTVDYNGAGPFTNQRIALQKSLSRKGSQRNSEKKAAEAGSASAAAAAAGGGAGADKSVTVVLSGGGSAPESATSPPSPVAVPSRRSHVRRTSSSAPWLGPRRVLLFFATLSSMGTIILLYFTLSMGGMDGGDANAR